MRGVKNPPPRWSSEHLQRLVRESRAPELRRPDVDNDTGFVAAWHRAQHPEIKPPPHTYERWPLIDTTYQPWGFD